MSLRGSSYNSRPLDHMRGITSRELMADFSTMPDCKLWSFGHFKEIMSLKAPLAPWQVGLWVEMFDRYIYYYEVHCEEAQLLQKLAGC